MNKILERYKKLPVQVKASVCFLICSFFQKGISIITTPIFTRILSTAEYGKFSVFNSWMQIIAPVISLNLFSGVYSQGIIKFEDDRDRYSSSLQGLSLVLISSWLIIYLIFRDTFNSLFLLTTGQMLALILMVWASGCFSFWSMDQRADFKYKKLVAITVAVSIFQPLVGIILVLNSQDKVTARIIGMAAVQLFFYIGAFIYQMFRGKQFFSKYYWSYALKFNLPLLPHYLSLTVLSSSDRIMINNIAGSDKAGIYNLAYSVSLIMTIFNTALLQTIEPWIYRKLKDNKIDEISKVAYPCFVIISGLNILLILFAPEVIAVFAPKEYHEAIWIVPSVALSVFFMFLYSFFATFEFYYEKTKYIAAATVGGAILNIGLNYVFIHQYGYIAAGYTTLFSYMLYAFLHYYFMKKICCQFLNNAKPYNGNLIVLIGIISIVFGFIGLLLYQFPVFRYSIIVAVILFMTIFQKRIFMIIKLLISMRRAK